jgi:hypothetical protein
MTDTEQRPARATRRRILRAATLIAALAIAGAMTSAYVAEARVSHERPKVPRSAALETKTGVQIVRATLAADGGLLDVRYVVLDAPDAQLWMGDTSKPPELRDQRDSGVIDRVAPMRDAHAQRPGQTYFLIYQNTGNAIHRGDLIDLTVAGVTLHDIPVE